MGTVYLIRGVPGSGKSTLAKKLCFKENICEADDFYTDENGVKRYDSLQAWIAEYECYAKCKRLMERNEPVIAVANVFCYQEMLQQYYRLAEQYNYTVHEIISHGRFKSVHSVPDEFVEELREVFEYR